MTFTLKQLSKEQKERSKADTERAKIALENKILRFQYWLQILLRLFQGKVRKVAERKRGDSTELSEADGTTSKETIRSNSRVRSHRNCGKNNYYKNKDYEFSIVHFFGELCLVTVAIPYSQNERIL